jgi:hypothetical protein
MGRVVHRGGSAVVAVDASQHARRHGGGGGGGGGGASVRDAEADSRAEDDDKGVEEWRDCTREMRGAIRQVTA